MAESSRFWNGTTLGDATEAPYDGYTEFSEVMQHIAGAFNAGVFLGVLNELAISDLGGGNIQVGTGCGICYGAWYKNTAAITINIPTPVGGIRIDRIILRKDWAAQTVRCVRLAGVVGAAAPALTQIIGTTWEYQIAQVAIDAGGAYTIYDTRHFIGVPIAARQGGSATNWAVQGTTKYTPVEPKFQFGVYEVTVLDTKVSVAFTITFPIQFKYTPVVTFTTKQASGDVAEIVASAQIIVASSNQVTGYATRRNPSVTAGAQVIEIHWMAVGEAFFYD